MRHANGELELAHIHVGVRDIPAAKRWFRDVMGRDPALATGNLVVFAMGSVAVALDQADADVPVTLAVAAPSCDQLHDRLVSRGAKSIAPPSSKPWSVRSAYLKGPGAITLEIEEALGAGTHVEQRQPDRQASEETR